MFKLCLHTKTGRTIELQTTMHDLQPVEVEHFAAGLSKNWYTPIVDLSRPDHEKVRYVEGKELLADV